uniref:HEAT repeat domain-containing protein n=1 Tax=Eiseniibacteriota bacterium TaxID=2212470 RepID=A0A832MLA4_UNCEI
MNVPPRTMDAPAEEPRTPEQDAAIRAASVWIHQFARTLKTCRLYDAANPTVLKFRAELAATLQRVLSQHGTLRYRFTSDDVLCEDESLYPARSRDDNLALVFFRDGVRALTFTPGVEARELDVLLDCVLQVSGQNFGEDDLVTLLWEAALPHIEVDYVPGEGDIGSGAGQVAGPDESGPLLPWPAGGGEEEEAPQVEGTAEVDPARAGRSDDWTAGDLTVEIEAGYEELEALSSSEVLRFRREFEAEHAVSLVTATVAIAHAYLNAGATPDDRAELTRFMPRVLRQAISRGAWLEAREALLLLRECGAKEWSVDTLVQELLQPISVSATVDLLDKQEGDAVLDYLAFARELGDPAVDWLSLVLAESQSRRNRRLVAEAIAALCKDRPERLAPWISDPRWFVVRNVVHILGWIAGPKIVPLLQVAIRNPDPRVRLEVVQTLGQVDPKLARPLLLRLLEGADTRMFCMVLHQLSAQRDPALARRLVAQMQDPGFESRAQDERHAIYSALAAVGGDEIVADLEAEVHRGNWFSRGAEAHRQAVARILARIGTPAARLVLERGAQSKRGPVRKACEDAMGGLRDAA